MSNKSFQAIVSVPVDNSVGVEVLQSEENFGCVEFGLTQRELLPLDVQHEIASAHILHDEVHPSFGLET